MKRVIMVCKHCGSDAVGCEANAVWDVEAQDWVLGGMHDDEWCGECGADGHNVIIEKEIPDDVLRRDHQGRD